MNYTKYSTSILVAFLLAPFMLCCQSTSPSDTGIVLNLTCGPDNPRNGEGDFVTLKDGRILFIYSRFSGDVMSDHSPADLVSRYSTDQGKTWSQDDELVVPSEGDMNVMSVSLLRLPNGNIALFYMRKNSLEDCLISMRISEDESKSWSEPTLVISDLNGYFVTICDRVIVLKSGRILVPVSRHNEPGSNYSNKGEMRCYYSDDEGLSWNTGSVVPSPDSLITQEPGVVELEDGRLLMYIRTNAGFQHKSYSTDGGINWSHCEVSNIVSPVSPACFERIKQTGDILLVWNNNGKTGPGYFKAKRNPLSLAYSADEGASWSFVRNLESDPDGFFCYTAIHEVDGYILLSYLKKKIDDPHMGACIRRISISEIEKS